MRNVWRVLAFDIVAPLAAIAALLMIGVPLGWPLWWVSACSVLCLLIVQGMVVNFVVARRDSVTVGTDDGRPGLRLAVVVLTTIALVAAVLVGLTRWTVPDRATEADEREVTGLAATVAEATATFSPSDPMSSIDRAALLMAPGQAEAYKKKFGDIAEDLAGKNISSKAATVSAGIEAMTTDAADVAVILRTTQTSPGSPPERAVAPLEVTLIEHQGKWQVLDVTPVNPSPHTAEESPDHS